MAGRDGGGVEDRPGGPLICPTCRRPEWASPLLAGSTTCSNDECGRLHPLLAGTQIPLLVPGASTEYLARDASVDFSDPADVGAWVAGLEPGSGPWESALRLGMYAVGHYGSDATLFTRLHRRFIEPLTAEIRVAVDLGCGVGGLAHALARGTRCHVIAIDADALALRLGSAVSNGSEITVPALEAGLRLGTRTIPNSGAAPSTSIEWLCADVHHPPLMPEAFDLVTAVNLVDTTADPAVALGQAASLVRPGGHLLLAQPDAWSASATDPTRWLPSTDAAWDGLLRRYGLETIDREDGFDWELARTPRYRFRYVAHARLARRFSRPN